MDAIARQRGLEVPGDPPDVSPGETAPLLTRQDRVLLVCGAAVILVVVLGAVEALVIGTGLPPESARWVYLGRGALASVLLGLWAGWTVMRFYRRLERERGAFQEQSRVLAERARRAERSAGLAALSRQLAHEVRNPLHAIVLHLRLLRRQIGGEPVEACVATVERLEEEVARIDRLVEEHQRHLQSANPRVNPGPVDLLALLSEESARHRAALFRTGVTLRSELPEHLPRLYGDPGLLRQLVQQLGQYAAENVAPGGTVRLRAMEEDRSVCLELGADCAACEETRDAAGSVLRRAIIRDVARVHGGEYQEEQEAGGFRIRVRLPLGDAG